MLWQVLIAVRVSVLCQPESLQESADIARPVNVIGIDSLQCGMIESCNSIFAHGCTQLLAELRCLSRIFQSECALLYESNDKREVPLGNSMCL